MTDTPITGQRRGMNAKELVVRFIKFNIVGVLVFLIGTVIYAASFNSFGFWAWIVANGAGAILQFTLITVLNKTQRGKIFDSCQDKR